MLSIVVINSWTATPAGRAIVAVGDTSVETNARVDSEDEAVGLTLPVGALVADALVAPVLETLDSDDVGLPYDVPLVEAETLLVVNTLCELVLLGLLTRAVALALGSALDGAGVLVLSVVAEVELLAAADWTLLDVVETVEENVAAIASLRLAVPVLDAAGNG